ncbi:MAG: hypothetical protein ABSC64_02460 [Candidatus Korobacteraceae bacterium]|jgi:chromosome segregation ATPase
MTSSSNEAGASELDKLNKRVAQLETALTMMQQQYESGLTERSNQWEEIREQNDALDKLYTAFEEATRIRDLREEGNCKFCPYHQKVKEYIEQVTVH